MSKRTNRPVASLLLAAAAFAGVPAQTLVAEPADGGPRLSEGLSSERALLRAAELLEQGRAVHARALLLEVLDGDGQGLSDREREHGFRLLTDASRRMHALPAAEQSLQRAELALAQGDIIVAERHCRAVIGTSGVDSSRLVRAERLLDQAERRRVELEPLVSGAILAAAAAAEDGDLVRAKREISWIVRSGVSLSDAQRERVEMLQLRVVSAERATGELLGGATVTLAAVQPGVVRGNQPPAGDPDPSEPPEPAEPLTDDPPTQPADDLIAEANRREAARILQEADRDFREQRYRDALAKYSQIRQDYGAYLDPLMLQSLNTRIADTQARLADPVTATGLEDVLSEREKVRQEARASFANLVQQSREARRTGDFALAMDLALQARLRIQAVRDFFMASEYEGYVNEIESLRAEIERAQEQARIRALQERERELAAAAAREAAEREATRRRQIDEAILRVRDLQMNMQYREALDVINQQILFLDPNNPAGLLLLDIIHDTALFAESRRLGKEMNYNLAELRVQNMEAMVPPVGIVGFPRDWPQLSYLRSAAGQYAESPENRAVYAAIRDRRLPTVELAGNTLEQALGFLQTVAQVNMDVDWDALDAVNIGRDSTVNLSLRNVQVETVLNRVLEKVSREEFGEKASWGVQHGVLVVSSDERIRRNRVLEIYDIRDLVVEVPDYTDAPQFDLNQILQSGGGGGGGSQSPFQQSGNQDDWQRTPLQDRLDRMKEIIRENVDFENWRENGGDTGYIQDWQGQLIITNTPANHQQIRGLLNKLREVRAMQINVEARFMLVSQDFFEQIGFDLDVYFNARNNQITAARGVDPTIMPSDFFGQTGRLQRDVAGAVNPPGTGAGVGVLPPERWSPIGTISNSLGLAGALAPAEGIASTILGAGPALGVSGQFLDDIQVDFLLQATQADRRSVTLTAPRLTFTNGQTSNIYVVTQIGFISDLAPVVSDSAVGFDPTVDVISEGVRLIVEGTISADRRFVTMNVDAAIAQIEGFESQPVTAIAGGQLVSSQDTQSFIQVPTTTVTRVQTTVTVPDQGTILLGGQRLVSEFEVETGVPVLSKIPVLNRFFTNRITTKEESTLLILLKPTVLIQSEQEEQQYPGLAESLGFIGG